MDSTTVIAALVHGLTGNVIAVGAASAISRYGWMFPQLFVAYFARLRERRMPFYMVGAFGRAGCLTAIAVLLAISGDLPRGLVIVLFFGMWTTYAFVSGIVAVPYNDIVARSIPSGHRSRLLATRFFGGGLLALGIAAAAHQVLNTMAFPGGYAVLVALGAALLILSSVSFVSAGEPKTAAQAPIAGGFIGFLREGGAVFRGNRRFRLFVYTQWLGGAVMMSFPFYILQAMEIRGDVSDVGILLGAQTVGAILSNALWGWWGDHFGKRSLLQGVVILRAGPPLLTLFWTSTAISGNVPALAGYAVVFFLLGALGNGITIAVLGYLMEISPDENRPAYSGYFSAITAPANLLPLAGAVIVETFSLPGVFLVSLAAALLQSLTVYRLRGELAGDQPP